jgi:Asp/Glu/hydantoin racemase
MSKKLAFIHTVSPLITVFNKLAHHMLPGAELTHILDEPLLDLVRRRGELAPQDARRLLDHMQAAHAAGAGAVLVTCSTISPLVDQIRSQAGIPVVKIDEAMIHKAVSLGQRVGVVATNQATLQPTRLLLEAASKQIGRPVQVEMRLVENGLDALLAGQEELHDRLVIQALLALAPQVDVIVMAQASMARVLEAMPPDNLVIPVLSSPYLALEQAAAALSENA